MDLLDSLKVLSQEGDLVPASSATSNPQRFVPQKPGQHSSQRTRAMDVEMTSPSSGQIANGGSVASLWTPTNPVEFELIDADVYDAQQPPPPKPVDGGVLVPLAPQMPTGEPAAKFNHICQTHSIIPDFTFFEVTKGVFKARVVFGDHVIESTPTFPNKRTARDEVSKQGIAILEGIEPPDRKRKATELETAFIKPGLHDENWRDILNNYAQTNSLSTPIYQEYEADKRKQQARGEYNSNKQFACTVTISSMPSQPFGSTEELFPSKSDARRNASMAAVHWLRATGKLAIPQKRQKSDVDAVPEGHTGLTQGISQMYTKGASAAQCVQDLSHRLGFTSPQYVSQPCAPLPGDTTVGLIRMHAIFLDQDVAREPRLKGPLGQTGRIYGKKLAKEECCNGVLRVLEDIAAHR